MEVEGVQEVEEVDLPLRFITTLPPRIGRAVLLPLTTTVALSTFHSFGIDPHPRRSLDAICFTKRSVQCCFSVLRFDVRLRACPRFLFNSGPGCVPDSLSFNCTPPGEKENEMGSLRRAKSWPLQIHDESAQRGFYTTVADIAARRLRIIKYYSLFQVHMSPTPVLLLRL
ncbi:unnamed protein product [Zymoseptoria tritici ST99CH_3D1]|nr:unnamed protein product [Zymoseptoria tritici ST99CH_3D1]